jgi:hypothetical protein
VADAACAVPIDAGRAVAFEWIGRANHLDERSPKRKRGAWGTSADAFVVLAMKDGSRTGLLIEWKYTEQYPLDEPKKSTHYDAMILAPASPFVLAESGSAVVLRYEPFYQLARLTLLAARMAASREDGVDRVLVLWVVPEGNSDLLARITSPVLRARFPGLAVPAVFQRVLTDPTRFRVASPAGLLRAFPIDRYKGVAPAVAEARSRYSEGR